MKNNNQYLKAFILCLLSFLVDLFVFKRELLDILYYYVEYRTLLYGIFRLGLHAFMIISVATAFYGLLRSIPKIGVFIQWFVWLFINMSYHLFYVVTNRLPNTQDLRNLLITPFNMSTGTILSTFSLNVLTEGFAPVAFVIVLFVIIQKLCTFFKFPKEHDFKRLSIVSVISMSIIVIYMSALYVLAIMNFVPTMIGTFANSIKLFIAYLNEAQHSPIQRFSYTPPNAMQ